MPDNAPYTSRVFELQKDWIDFNGHLNMAYYTVLFDRAYEEVGESLGMGAHYAATRRPTTYTAEIHLCYVRELHLSDRVCGTYQLLDHDEKRLHSYQELRHADEGWLAATCETMTLHIDMSGPKVTPFPRDVLERVEAMRTLHATLETPARAGRSIAIRRRKS